MEKETAVWREGEAGAGAGLLLSSSRLREGRWPSEKARRWWPSWEEEERWKMNKTNQKELPEMSGQSKRGPSFTKAQDVVICEGWLHHSQDSIHGISQATSSFWSKIHADYGKFTGDTIRSVSSLKQRWTLINKLCSKWNGCINRADSIRPSGSGPLEMDKLVRDMYLQEMGDKPFPFEHCWPKLQNQVKWRRLQSMASSASSSHVGSPMSQEFDTPSLTTPMTIPIADDDVPSGRDDPIRERPIGSRAAKKARSLEFSSYVASTQASREKYRDTKLQIESDKAIAMRAEAEAVKKIADQQEWEMDHMVMSKDLASIEDSMERAYWQSQKAKIMAKEFGTSGSFARDILDNY